MAYDEMRRHLAEELFERVTADNVCVSFEARFSECFLKEFSHVQANAQEFALFFFLEEELTRGN